jgi:cell division protein FtsW
MNRSSPLDPVLVGSTLALVGIGAVMVSSATISIADQTLGHFQQHLLALAIGIAGMLVVLRIPIEWWNRSATLALVTAFALLILVLLPGVADLKNGARRWVDLGPISFQASELARLLLLVYVVSYAIRRSDALGTRCSGFLRPMLLIALASALLLLEPDFGATAVLTATSFGILFLAGARLRDVLGFGLAAVGAAAALIFSQPYRVERLLCSWFNPEEHQFDCGYQLFNSFIAIGSGNWLGVGLGAGVQKLRYLPDAHTDFIFAVLAEEFGLIGSTLVIALFAAIVYRAFELGRRGVAVGLPFHGLLCMGIGLMLGLEAAISIGVNTGLLPTKGLALPLISFGRTSAVVTLLALGILFRAAAEITRAAEPVPRRGLP